MKRVATITENGNAWCELVSRAGTMDEIPLGVIGPLDRIDNLGDEFLLTATNGCCMYVDEIRREK